MKIDSVAALAASAKEGGDPPADLDPAVEALWLTKAGRWEDAHHLAQSMGDMTGDWIHGLLHLIEGDLGNAAYWYGRVGRSRPAREEAETEWERIARTVLGAG
ncbi:MAG TPA: hypothetical protein VMN36_11445 [Verrucomicrobiales bacterium]|nr:hypothetical protein [Verrucomicrobiales bacterium]